MGARRERPARARRLLIGRREGGGRAGGRETAPLPPPPGRAQDGERMLWGGCLWLAALCLAGVSPHPEPGGGPRDPGGATHDHRDGFAYDHAAFLGAEGAREFEQLPPAESQRRLGLLVELIDGDSDGGVTAAELGAWMQRRRRGAREESVRGGRRRYDRDGDGRVAWAEYRALAYGDAEEDFGDTQHPDTYRRLLARDERRFRAADADGDGTADAEELAAFLHPEDFEHMRELVVTETLEDMDKDGDGFIQEDEYIAELYAGGPRRPRAAVGARGAGAVRGGAGRDRDATAPGPRRTGALAAPPQRRLGRRGGRAPAAPRRPRPGRAADARRGAGQLGAVRGQPGHRLRAGPAAPAGRALTRGGQGINRGGGGQPPPPSPLPKNTERCWRGREPRVTVGDAPPQ
ncbi:reticulocalbin-3-like [Chlamydotis macqueenii]